MTSLLTGQVVSHLGQGISVEHSGQIKLCQTLRKLDTVVVGDQVLWTETGPDHGRIEKILPRRSVLLRPNKNRTTRPVAANLDTLYVVFAFEPLCDFLLIDQYLAICENNHINAALVLNKADLPADTTILGELQLYQKLGYTLYTVSAKQQQGLKELTHAMQDKTSMLVGQSGVGKSSLTNALLPDKDIKTNTLSNIHKHGRHTTTAAPLYHLPSGGDLIDSPGVAIFGLAGLTESLLAQGYREFQPLIEQCKFLNCRHVKDLGCAVRLAAENGEIAISRYQRFLKLREKMPLD